MSTQQPLLAQVPEPVRDSVTAHAPLVHRDLDDRPAEGAIAWAHGPAVARLDAVDVPEHLEGRVLLRAFAFLREEVHLGPAARDAEVVVLRDAGGLVALGIVDRARRQVLEVANAALVDRRVADPRVHVVPADTGLRVGGVARADHRDLRQALGLREQVDLRVHVGRVLVAVAAPMADDRPALLGGIGAEHVHQVLPHRPDLVVVLDEAHVDAAVIRLDQLVREVPDREREERHPDGLARLRAVDGDHHLPEVDQHLRGVHVPRDVVGHAGPERRLVVRGYRGNKHAGDQRDGGTRQRKVAGSRGKDSHGSRLMLTRRGDRLLWYERLSEPVARSAAPR